MLGVYALSTRPLTAFRRRGIGPISAFGIIAGAGAATAVSISKVFAVAVAAGTGAASGVMSAPATAVASTAGVGAVAGISVSKGFSIGATSGVAAVTGSSVSKSSSIGASAGLSTPLSLSIVKTSSVASSAGLGVANGVLRATVVSIGFAAGVGSAGATDSPSSVARAGGTSVAFGVSYAFYVDAEVACVHEEIKFEDTRLEDRTSIIPFDPLRPGASLMQRVSSAPCLGARPLGTFSFRYNFVRVDNPDAIVAVIPFENRIAIVLPEDRVYEVGFEVRAPGTENRKRIC